MHDSRLVISLKPSKPSAAPTPIPQEPEPELHKRAPFTLSDAHKRVALYAGALLLVIVLGSAGGFSVFRWWTTRSTNATTGMQGKVDSGRPATTAGSTNDVNEVVAKVSRLIELPQGEAPTVAAVTDPVKLSNQSFFARAKVGDQVLVYTKARKAILYDPAADKIIEVAPIAVDAQ